MRRRMCGRCRHKDSKLKPTPSLLSEPVASALPSPPLSSPPPALPPPVLADAATAATPSTAPLSADEVREWAVLTRRQLDNDASSGLLTVPSTSGHGKSKRLRAEVVPQVKS